MFYQWKPYVTVAERRRKAAKELAKLHKQGRDTVPVVIQGKRIANTFWGRAWCDNLEAYSDFENRLPRGRTYVRNGSVIDLQVVPGKIEALVSGSEIYRVTVNVTAVAAAQWTSICQDCAGAIDSLVELLRGRLSTGVMSRICQQRTGLFPVPSDLKFTCSCPDWASMCKHVAAVLYGFGARLDDKPDLLFRLRQVNELELITSASHGAELTVSAPAAAKTLDGEDLSAIFGLELDTVPPASAAVSVTKNQPQPAQRKSAQKKAQPTAQPANKAAAKGNAAAPTPAKTRGRPAKKANKAT